jgi:hypothetical protein
MSETGTSDQGRSPVLRVSEAERDRAATLLATCCGEGRLTLEEFSERVEIVLAAKTQADLDSVTADLPTGEAVAPYRSPVPASGWLAAVMSASSRVGRWRPKGRIRAVALMGSVHIDLRSAEIEGPTLTITALSIMGDISIVLPEGVAVDVSGANFMGTKHVGIADVPILRGGPVISIRAFPIMGAVSVRTRRSRPPRGEAPPIAVPASPALDAPPGASVQASPASMAGTEVPGSTGSPGLLGVDSISNPSLPSGPDHLHAIDEEKAQEGHG